MSCWARNSCSCSCPIPGQRGALSQIEALARCQEDLSRLYRAYLATGTPPEVNRQLSEDSRRFTLLSDSEERVFRGLGIETRAPSAGKGHANACTGLVVADENQRILRNEGHLETADPAVSPSCMSRRFSSRRSAGN